MIEGERAERKQLEREIQEKNQEMDAFLEQERRKI